MAGVAGSPSPSTDGRIGVIVTEHPAYVSAAQQEEVAKLQALISRIAGYDVVSSHYLDAWELAGFGALVLTGSHAPWSAHRDRDLVALGERVKAFGGPVFGICAGMQLLARFAGGEVRPCGRGEKGFTKVSLDTSFEIFRDLPSEVEVFQHHSDEVATLPSSASVVARNEACGVQALTMSDRPWWGTQFHPEVTDELHPAGLPILEQAVLGLLERVPPGELVDDTGPQITKETRP